jgi:hypothetical protein
MDKKVQAVLATYLRAAIASVIALYLAGETDPKKLGTAAIAGIAGPVLKWLDPKATEFGRGSK